MFDSKCWSAEVEACSWDWRWRPDRMAGGLLGLAVLVHIRSGERGIRSRGTTMGDGDVVADGEEC
jgi:hypothetical protein